MNLMSFEQFYVIVEGLALALLIWWFIVKLIDWTKNLPPGPWGIPIFGYMPFVGNPPYLKLQEIADKYGPICSFYLGNQLVILLNEFDVIKEALIKQAENFAGRPEGLPFKLHKTDVGIITLEGKEFRLMKTFTMSTLKNAGGVKEYLQVIIRENFESFLKYLESTNGEATDVLEPLGICIAQTYCSLMLGRRFDDDDPKFRTFIDHLYQEQRMYGNGIRTYMLWTRKVPILNWMLGELEARRVRRCIINFIDEVIRQNETTYVEGSTDNFAHAWLTEANERKRKDPNETLFNTRDHMLFNLAIVFAGGYETTTTTLRWALIFLMLHPEVQEKIQLEIDEIVGSDRLPTMSDKDSMVYLQATIQEIHRCATIGPLGVPHRNLETTTLSGYTIPKSCFVLSNHWRVLRDPKYFPDPEIFRPERFIDANGKFIKCEQVLIFSLGKRRCPGESFAEVELFISLSFILQSFYIRKPKSEKLSLERSGSLSANPNPFKCEFINRRHI